MNETDPDLWARRRRRAEAHTRRLVAEWERAKEKGQRPKWVTYEYDEPTEQEDNDGGESRDASVRV